MSNKKVGAEKYRWDLSGLYSGIKDPQIDADIKKLTAKAKKFYSTHKGNLKRTLRIAINDYSEIAMLENKITLYLYLKQSENVRNSDVNSKVAEVNRVLSHLHGAYLTFLEIEIVKFTEKELSAFYKKDKLVNKHRPWIEHIRIFKSHILSEEVESAIIKRAPFSAGAWSEFFDEVEADLEFEFKGKKKTLTEMTHLLSESKSSDERSEVMSIINSGLGGTFAKYSAQTLYMITGENAVELKERNYKNPMVPRNKSNQVSDEVVNALHLAIKKNATPLVKDYYKLKASVLGLKKLKWSDRNAPLPFSDTTRIPFNDALAIVTEAYESFSPTLAGLVKKFIETKKIDAPAVKGKMSGGFNYSVILPNYIQESFTLINYIGSNRDVMTLAHELGHGVHGIISGVAQGPLMFHAPIAYCETASVFGEVTTFNFLKKKLIEKGDIKSLLALLMGKIDDTINTTVRQIGFSNFERRIHGMNENYKHWSSPKKLSVKELDKIWIETIKELYGEDGEVFSYKNIEHLWAYIGHFHRPFYNYGYAFGELLTQSIYARQNDFGNKFEPLYLDMLKSGMTKNVTQLLKPFNLDPTHPSFWADGINIGLGEMIKEAKELYSKCRR